MVYGFYEPLRQAGLVSVVVGAGKVAWFGLYVNSTSENPGKIVVQTTCNYQQADSLIQNQALKQIMIQ